MKELVSIQTDKGIYNMKWESYNTSNIRKRYLYRFLSLNHTKTFLTTGNIWFARADQFGDKMECVRISDLIGARPNIEQIEATKKKHLISCWHLADNESLALWDTSHQGANRRVCSIRFGVEDLKELITTQVTSLWKLKPKKLIHGRVQYKNLISPKASAQATVKFSAFRKEQAFKYESEYRYMIQLHESANELGLNYSLQGHWLDKVHVIVNPLLTKTEYFNVKTELAPLSPNGIHNSTLAKWLKPELW